MSMRMNMIGLFVVAAAISACKDDPKPAPAAPAATPAASAASKPAEAPKPAAAPAAAAKPSKDKKKSLPAAVQPHPVPADWTELQDNARGFSFSVPSGSKGGGKDEGGVGAFVAVLPKPFDNVLTMVVAYKDAKKTLDDLEKQSTELVEKVFAETGAKVVSKKDLTDDYRLIEITSKDAKSDQKSHWKALAATDVTDNYIMVVGTPETEFKKNEPTIDEIWGSFDMWSGGSAGDSHGASDDKDEKDDKDDKAKPE